MHTLSGILSVSRAKLLIPPNLQTIEVIKMPACQNEQYKLMLQRVAEQAREATKAKGVETGDKKTTVWDGKWMTNVFTELRKAAQHPLLLQKHYTAKVSHHSSTRICQHVMYV